MPTSTLPLSDLVVKIIAIGHDSISPAEARHVLKWAACTFTTACMRGQIEAQHLNTRGRGIRKRWSFSRAALLTFIWNTTTGDKTLMRAALAQHAPELLHLLEPAVPGPAAAEAAPQADNIIQMPPAKRTRRTDPAAPQMGDLFSHLNVG